MPTFDGLVGWFNVSTGRRHDSVVQFARSRVAKRRCRLKNQEFDFVAKTVLNVDVALLLEKFRLECSTQKISSAAPTVVYYSKLPCQEKLKVGQYYSKLPCQEKIESGTTSDLTPRATRAFFCLSGTKSDTTATTAAHISNACCYRYFLKPQSHTKHLSQADRPLLHPACDLHFSKHCA